MMIYNYFIRNTDDVQFTEMIDVMEVRNAGRTMKLLLNLFKSVITHLGADKAEDGYHYGYGNLG